MSHCISHPLLFKAVLYNRLPSDNLWLGMQTRKNPHTLYSFRELFQAKYMRCRAASQMGRGEKELFFFRLYNFKKSIYWKSNYRYKIIFVQYIVKTVSSRADGTFEGGGKGTDLSTFLKYMTRSIQGHFVLCNSEHVYNSSPVFILKFPALQNFTTSINK